MDKKKVAGLWDQLQSRWTSTTFMPLTATGRVGCWAGSAYVCEQGNKLVSNLASRIPWQRKNLKSPKPFAKQLYTSLDELSAGFASCEIAIEQSRTVERSQST